MAAVSKLTGQLVEPCFPHLSEIYPIIANESVTNGAPAYLASTGKYGLADADASGKQQFRGIILEAAGAGQGTSLLTKGKVWGFDLSSLAYDALVYLADAVGTYVDTAGTMTVIVGRVVPLSDRDLTKVLEINVDPIRIWS